MISTKSTVVALLFVMHISAFGRLHNTDWTVSYYEGKSGKVISIPECELVSVTSDSFHFLIKGQNRSIPLYLMYELSHPNNENSYVKPILIGAAIGATCGFLASLFVEGPSIPHDDRPISRGQVALFFGAIGSGLGLAKAIDLDYVKYHFPPATIVDKRAVIQKIIDEEGGNDLIRR